MLLDWYQSRGRDLAWDQVAATRPKSPDDPADPAYDFRRADEMARQTLQLLGERRRIDGYVEIGTTGRYASVLRKRLQLTGRT